jgi:hypothetical protein
LPKIFFVFGSESSLEDSLSQSNLKFCKSVGHLGPDERRSVKPLFASLLLPSGVPLRFRIIETGANKEGLHALILAMVF